MTMGSIPWGKLVPFSTFTDMNILYFMPKLHKNVQNESLTKSFFSEHHPELVKIN